MIKKIFICVLLILFIYGCTKNEKIVIVDQRSFLFVNLIQEFPIINFESVSKSNDTLGLTWKQYIPNDSQKTYLRDVIINYSKKNITYHSLDWSPSSTFQYDSTNRLQGQKIYSCFTWNISFCYLDTLGSIYQFSTIEDDSDNGSDTTIFKLDSYGRVTQVNGIDYGDLYKVRYSKNVYYSELHSIPDSIISIYKRNKNINKLRKELFYQTKQKIDSIQIEDSEFDTNYSVKTFFTNYFNTQEKYVGAKISNLNSKIEKFLYVEKIVH
jgi:hypothetical protein